MTALPPPEGRPRAGDDIDPLLRAFFQAELPRPWPPAPKTPPPTVGAPEPASAGGRRPAKARLTLAASVALMASAAWLVSGPGERPGVAGSQPGVDIGEVIDGVAEKPKLPEADPKVENLDPLDDMP